MLDFKHCNKSHRGKDGESPEKRIESGDAKKIKRLREKLKQEKDLIQKKKEMDFYLYYNDHTAIVPVPSARRNNQPCNQGSDYKGDAAEQINDSVELLGMILGVAANPAHAIEHIATETFTEGALEVIKDDHEDRQLSPDEIERLKEAMKGMDSVQQEGVIRHMNTMLLAQHASADQRDGLGEVRGGGLHEKLSASQLEELKKMIPALDPSQRGRNIDDSDGVGPSL